MPKAQHIFIPGFYLEFVQSCGHMNWERCATMYLSHTRTPVLAGTLKERTLSLLLPYYSRRMKGENPTLFCVIMANFLIFSISFLPMIAR